MTNKVKSILAIVFLVAGFGALAYLAYNAIQLIIWAPLYSELYSSYGYGYGYGGYSYFIAGTIVSAVMMIVFFVLFFRYRRFNKHLRKFHI